MLPESKPVVRAAAKLRHERCVCGMVKYGAMLSEPWPSNTRDAHLSPVLTNGGAPAFRIFGILKNQDILTFPRAQLSLWVVPRPLEDPPYLRAATFLGTTSQLQDTRSDRETT